MRLFVFCLFFGLSFLCGTPLDSVKLSSELSGSNDSIRSKETLSLVCQTKKSEEEFLDLMAGAESKYVSKHMDDLEKADDLLLDFNKKMEWFLNYKNKCLNDSKETLEKNGLFEQYRTENESFAKKVRKHQAMFETFRDKTADLVASNFGNSSYAQTLRSFTVLEITKWYVQYIEEVVFPQTWEIMYANSE